MKRIIALFILFNACTNTNHFSGVYTRHVESKYSVGEDTLFISHADGHYNMERHTGYRRIKNGTPGVKEIKLYHAVLAQLGNGQWEDMKAGTVITFNGDSLSLGTAGYQKIK